ncbi:hypothetical protein [Rhizobium sp. TRM95796]|uniref:hypothetical protein n=1 Tax=Rhizobium sp. TRM95796 TaxID=2979862 RepID=UPI0039952BBF
MAGEPYSQSITATGGVGAMTFSLASGDLPKGLTLNISTGGPFVSAENTFVEPKNAGVATIFAAASLRRRRPRLLAGICSSNRIPATPDR